MNKKICTHCNISKTLDQFNKGNDKDNLKRWCKECCKENKYSNLDLIKCKLL
jgi:hypothetical protein